ncbi:MAG: periplasmic heavy metal sensor [Myxococcota bacterium]|nr:periplasmic heavy metal sensor [Myxococcota bacterium]
MNSTKSKADPKIAIFILVTFTLSLMLATEAWSKPRRSDRNGPGAFPNQLLEEVGVDETVRNEIATISKSSESQAKDMHEKIHEARKGLRTLLEEDAPDSNLVMQQVEKIGALEIEADKHRLATMLSIRALLSPEQRIALEQLHEDHRDKRHGHKMRKVKRACGETLAGTCSDGQNDHEQIECLRNQESDTSDACKMALRKLHRPEHPRLGKGRHDTPDSPSSES